jgi:hypothetical protein
MNNTLEYGSVIKIVSSSSNSTYDGYFFVERLYDDQLVLISDKSTLSLGITDQELDDKTIEKIIIVYKPKQEQGFIHQHKFFISQRIEIEFEDVLPKLVGKIINIKDQVIEVETLEGVLYIPLNRGLPKHIVSIKTIHVKEPKPRQGHGAGAASELEDQEDLLEDGVLDVFEEDVEEEQYYYSIEQQKNDFLENLLMYVPLEQRSPRKLKELNKMIRRYVELRSKYTTFSDGIYVNHLQLDQIFATTVAFQNKLYVPITKNIEVKLSQSTEPETEETEVKEGFFKESDDNWKNDFSEMKDNIPFNKYLELLDNFDNLIYHPIEEAKKIKQIKYKPKGVSVLAYIIGQKEYPIMLSKPFVVDHFISHPKFFIEYSKSFLNRSFLLQKAQLSLKPYYPFIYNRDVGTFCDSHRVVYKNEETTFDKYIKKIIPTMEEFIDCANKQFVNMIDVYNELNLLDINELNETNYLLVNQMIKQNVHKIKQNFIKTRPSYLTKSIKTEIEPKTIILDILKEYENLSKFTELSHYSTSEIFKMAEIDLYRLLTFNYSIRNAALNYTTDAEIEGIIAEIKEDKDKPLEKRLNKIYGSNDEKDRDNYKPIIIRDVETEPGSGVYMSAIELLHRELIANDKSKITASLDHFKDQIDELIRDGIKYNEKTQLRFILNTYKLIKEFIIKNKIVKGDIAIVAETDTKYIWDNEKWIEYTGKEPIHKKLVTVKGNVEIDKQQKEQLYSEKIVELIKNIEKDRIKVRDLRAFYNEENKKELKQILKGLVKKNIIHGLKYNNDKLFLEKKEIGNKVGIIESPHEYLRDKILKVYELDIKYKALQIFIDKYCKKTPKDIYWYYCIDSGVKILPTFFNSLATAYLVTNNYEDVLETICLARGALSDNGDKWVDKYSGYIIKNIEFDYDEGYTETGFKNTSRGIVETPELPVKEDDPIMNSIKALIKYAGLSDIGDDIEWVYSNVMHSQQKAIRSIKKTEGSISGNALYVIAIISVVLVYAQSLEKINFIKSFPNCKASFNGYPISDGDSGIKYLCCIINKMEKPDMPFSSVRQFKVEDLESNVQQFIEKFLLTTIEIRDKLEYRRLHKIDEDVSNYTPWSLFLPRLKPFIPSVFVEMGQTNTDRMYYHSFIVQYKINRFVSTQPPILINHNQQPYLVNTCCNKDNNTAHYFAKKDPTIVDEIVEIRRLSKLEKIIQQKLKHPIIYSYENTKKVSIPISNDLDEITLFTGLIKLFNFDNEEPIPITLTTFEIQKPDKSYYNKNDDIQLKIRKLKEHGYDITEKMLYEILQNNATIVKDIVKEDHTVDRPIDDPIMEFIDTTELKNKTYEMLQQKRKLCDKYVGKNPYYNSVLNFIFKNEKRSDTIPVEMEHFTYLYQVLYNKIESLIIFVEMIITGKSMETVSVCKHWNLSKPHYKDIVDFVDSYYSRLRVFFKDDELLSALSKMPLDKYKAMLHLPLKDPETKFLMYHYIFVSIYELYLSSEIVSIKNYLDVVTKLFSNENDTAMNFDSTTIKSAVKRSKKSEAEIKKTYFSKLGSDELVSENTMKNLKLGKWGIGLQKSMFEYDKDTYLQDKKAATEVIELSGAQDLPDVPEVDEYAAFMPQDDDYAEGFDGDEIY